MITVSHLRNDATDETRDARTQLVASRNSLSGQKQPITPEAFKELALKNQLDRDTHYIVEGNLYFNDDSELTELLCPMTVKGSCEFNNCHNLTQLSNNLTVEDSLKILKCENLKPLRNYLTVGQELTITRCRQFFPLPAKLTLGNVVDVKNFTVQVKRL